MEYASKKHNKTDSTMEGWIKLHYKLLDWEWHDDPAMISLWVHLLLLANFEDKRWHDIIVKRGQFVTSLVNLQLRTGLSIRQIRTCLSRLQDCNQIECETTNKYTIVTICNFEDYQVKQLGERQTNDKQTTNQRQTNDKPTTTTEEYKNIDNIDVVDNNAHTYTHEGLVVGILEQTVSLNTFCMQNHISVDDFIALAHEVVNDWELQETTHTNETQARRHLFNTIRIKLKERKRNGNNRSTYEEQRDKLYAGSAAIIARLAAEDDARAAKVRNS